MAFNLPIDIINHALVGLGKERIRTLTDHSINAQEGASAYDDIRRIELRRSYWSFAIRRVILRAIDATTVLWTPAAYAASTTYGHGAVVTSGGDWWESQVAANVGNTPAPGPYWQHYYGADHADTYSATSSYASGELVIGSDNGVYRSLVTANTADPVAVGTGWLAIGGTTAALTVLYPIGAGPVTSSATKNVFRLPRGFLRRAPTDPKAGSSPYLGGPVNARSEDWLIEGGYIVSQDTGPLLLRYVADITDVSTMDPMFCSALASCIADDIAPRVLADASVSDRAQIMAAVRYDYKTTKSEAIQVNGIEVGAIEPYEDDYITVRW